MKYLVLAAAVSIVSSAAHAQIADVAVEIVDHFPDTQIRIVEHFEDERWQVVGTCPSSPDMAVQIVEHFEDLKVRIVEHFPDRVVCITRSDGLDAETRSLLNLND